MKIKLILLVLCVLFLCSDYATAQTRKPSPTPTPSEEPALTPLTEVERALDFQGIVANQPDFVAEESFFYNEGFGGFGATRRIARKGNRYFIDTGFVKIIVEPDKEIRLNDGSKTFEETPIRKDLVVGGGQPFNPQMLASQKGVKFTALGTQIIDGHKCLKIEAKLDGQNSQVFLYAAEDLKYLIIAAQVLNPPRSSVQKLQNISLEVPSQLIEIPPDYKPIPKYKWTRLDSAKVTLKGKTPEKYSVFRSEDGNQLFVNVYEPYPWSYLVFLKEQVSQIAFQGMLVTKNGDYAWRTYEKEATSNGIYKPDRDSYCKDGKCPKVVAGNNFVQFPSTDERSIIRVEW